MVRSAMKAVGTFPPVPRSTRDARRFVLEAVGQVPALPRAAIEVMVSELAMNAIQHAGTDFQVRVRVNGSVLRVEVSDHGVGIPRALPKPPPGGARGQGLSLVEHLADRWGVQPANGSGPTTVWFEISLAVAE
jgi:anti-sigma regulatory factor (Ser/Thr protein kinase)